MVVLLNIRAKIPPFESKSAHSSRKLPVPAFLLAMVNWVNIRTNRTQ